MINKKIRISNMLFICILCFALSIVPFIIKEHSLMASAYEIENQSDAYTEEDNFAEDNVIVVLQPEISQANKIHEFSFFNGIDIKEIEDLTYYDDPNADVISDFRQILMLTLNNGTKEKVLEAISILQSIPGVYSAEPNMYLESTSEPDDPEYINGNQWALYNDLDYSLNMPAVWDMAKDGKVVRVGILDTGVTKHPDLIDNLEVGWNYYENTNIADKSPYTHGTRVAGIIGAVANNGKGIAGMNWNVKLFPMRASNDYGYFEAKYVIKAIQDAEMKWWTDQRIDIINYSVGGYGSETAVLEKVRQYPGLFVWAAGNDNNDVDKVFKNCPDFDLTNVSNVIAVGALNSVSERWENIDDYKGSNYSLAGDKVDIFAPGAEILSTHYDTNSKTYTYVTDSGTSYAAPYVTGVASLLLSLNYNLSAAELKEIILKNADDVIISVYNSNGEPCEQSVKKLNALSAVSSLVLDFTERTEYVFINGVKYGKYEGELAIPEKINGTPVKFIAPEAFKGCTKISKVQIPKSVEHIYYSAFENCTNITSCYIEDDDFYGNSNLELIDSRAFKNCTNLKYMDFPNSLIKIGNNAFESSSIMKCSLDSDSLLQEIGDYAFYNSKIVFFDPKSSLTIIGANAFAECSSLFRVSLEDSLVISIGKNAFYNCKDLREIALPYSLCEVGENAFQNCTGLQKVSCATNTKFNLLKASTFANCTSLTIVELPTSLTSISDYAFSGCTNLTSIVLPDNLNSIGSKSFQNCSKLTFYTSKANAPSGWASGWNALSRPVVWNCKLATSVPYVSSFTKSATNPSNINATNGVSVPYRAGYTFSGWCTLADCSDTPYTDVSSAPNGVLYAKWTKEESSCVAEGTLITLADGRQVAVEDLTGDEQLLVWNLHTGKFDVAPILFIDRELRAEYEIIKLKFSDGTVVKVIDEHGFWDVNLNKYVYLDRGASKYIGHSFNKQTVDGNGNMAWTTVELVDVEICREITSAWSPVTYGHLCYYVNGMLSMPGGIGGLFNIFDVDGNTMQYDKAAFEEDIAKYGLFTYEEFAEQIPLSQEMFEACGGQYLKVAIGKGLITVDELSILVERYGVFFG